MTTIVSQTASAPNTQNTKNTKDNRKVVVAEHTVCLVFKIPNNLDLEDKTIVKKYWVKDGSMYLEYTSQEYFRQYYQDDDTTDFYISTKKCFVQKVQCESPYDDMWGQLKYPDTTKIEDAEGYMDYDDEEDEEDEEEVVEKKVEEKEKFYVMLEKQVKDGFVRERFEQFDTAEEARTDYERECACRGVAVSERYRVEFGTCNKDGNPDDTIEFFENEYTEEDDEEDEEDREEDEDGITEEMLQDFRNYFEKLEDTKSLQELRDYEADMERQNKWWLQNKMWS
jgi:hypothetical protein